MFRKNMEDSFLEEEDLDYLRSDFLSLREQEIEAEVPVPDRLLPRSKYREIVSRLRLSQMIGILLWLNREGVLSIGGRQRLLYLQEKASFEAISAGLKFAERLSKERKLQLDFKHAARELNRRPQSKRFRIREIRRIGVGYRDKGTLPDPSSRARRKADEDNFIHVDQFSERISSFLKTEMSDFLEGDWVDLGNLRSSNDPRVLTLTQLIRSL